MDPCARHHQISVVRVEIRDASANGLLVELLEVGPERHADRVVGRATDPAQAGRLLEGWLRGLLGQAASAPVPGGHAGADETPP